MKQLLLGVAIIVFALNLSACSSNKETALEKYQGMSSQELYNKGELALSGEEYGTATGYFEALNTLYPYSQYTEQGSLDLIYAYYMNDDKPSAVIQATQFLHLYPTSRRADYAYYMQGLSEFTQNRGIVEKYLPVNLALRDLTSAKQAYSDFNTLVTLYPKSPYTPDARQHMVAIRNMLAEHEINVAYFYLRRGAYVAAANRGSYIVKHYQRTPYVARALAVMVIAYNKLHLPLSANRAQRVLSLNYPHNRAIEKVQRKIG